MPFPHAGTNILEVELEPAPGELTPANNRLVVVAEGVRENLRVLLVSGEPHAGERTWRNLLKSDAAVDLVHFTILRPPEKQDGTPINQLSLIAFPTKELFSDKIKDFDLIIFDRYQHRGILQLIYYDNIARYVDNHGGALLIAAGDDYASNTSLYRTPLSPVLPASPTGRVIEEPFKAASHQRTASSTPSRSRFRAPITRSLQMAPTWGRWFRQAEVRADRGRTVMEGAEHQPLLVLDRKGKGRVALLTSDQAWLWARGYEGGGPHTDLLRRLSHWLMKEPDLEEERLIASAHGLKLTLERRSLEDTVGPVVLSGPGGEKSDVTLEPDGVRALEIDDRCQGPRPLQGRDPIDVGAADRRRPCRHRGSARDERGRRPPTSKLKPISDATGGGIFWTRTTAPAADAETVSVDLPRITMLAERQGPRRLGLDGPARTARRS